MAFGTACAEYADLVANWCEVIGGGLPPGAPNAFEGLCKVLHSAIDFATIPDIRIQAQAQISGATQYSALVDAVSTGPFATIPVTFPGDVTIESFTTDPVDPPATVGYIATANVTCAKANTGILLQISGTDGYYDEQYCTFSDAGNNSCSMYVPGAWMAGVVDTLTASILDGPTATAVNVFQ